MEFTRRKVRGHSQKTHKMWVSDCGDYRISWTNEYGFPHYYACVLTERFDGETWWNFALRRGPYKTRKKAAEECERNKKLWEAFIKLSHSDGRRDSRLETLKARAPNVFTSLPVWVRPLAEPSLIKMLFPCKILTENQCDDTEDSPTSEHGSLAGKQAPSDSSSKTPTSTPASTAMERDKSMTVNTHAGLMTDPTASPAPPAKEAVAAKRKTSKKPTKKASKSTATNSQPGSSGKHTAKADSKSSRKRKGQR